MIKHHMACSDAEFNRLIARAERRAETLRHSNEYQQLTSYEQSVVEHMALSDRAAYIIQLLKARS